MPGDYTRVSFDPRNDYSSVLLQQGRVTLDADVNEQVDLLDRRLRAEVVDTLARGVISRETPGAFLLTFAGGDLQIAPGRALVHGLLAENHGADPLAYDPVLGEQRGTNPIPYKQQPYLPDPDPLPASGTMLAYLDVWQREVSCLEEHEIVEQAVAVDTTTRRQTAWQVKFVEAADGDTCASENPAYDNATAPSAGRLSSGAVGVPASTEPCTIAPFGGFRGLRDRFYRVEIHDPGPLGTATFKCSRDNASLGATVLDIDAARTEIHLSRLGRDGVQRIAVGDWLEVTDDHRELHGEPGDLRQVVLVDEALAIVTLSAALTAGDFDATKPERHTRVVRWDQSGAAVDAAGGVVKVPAGGGGSPVALEDGVQVTFGVVTAGGSFRVGDHWQFAARTADASVEELVEEPPAGVLHHHMKLGVVTFPGTVLDCRPSGPVDEDCGCGCDVCITPESHASGALTIQAAVNQVRGTGGKICLTVGVYRLQEPVIIDRASSLHIEGRGWRTVVLAGRSGPAFVVERSIGVTIDLLTVVTASVSRRGQTAIGTAIALRTTAATLIERCVLLQLGLLEREPPDVPDEPRDPHPDDPEEPEDPCPPEELKPFPGKVRRLRDLRAPLGAKGTGGPLIALDGLVLETRIAENVLVGATGIGVLGADLGDPVTTDPDAGVKQSPAELTHVTPWVSSAEGRERTSYLLSFDLVIEDNLLVCWLTGVSLEGFTAHQGETRIRGNQALVCVRAGIATTGLVGSGGRVDIACNIVRVLGIGIAFAGDDTRVVENDVRLLTGVTRTRKEGTLTGLATTMSRDSGLLSESVSRVAAYLRLFGGDGIVAVPGIRPTGIDRALVRGNRVIEVLGSGILVQTHIVSGQITGNVIQQTGGMGIRMDRQSSADELVVGGNQLFLVNRLVPDERLSVAAAIVLLNSYEVAVHDNQIRRVGPREVVSGRFGVLVTGSTVVRVGTNSVHDVGIEELPGSAIAGAIAIAGAFARADVHDNTVRRGPRSLELQEASGGWTGISVLGSVLADDSVEIHVREAFEQVDPNAYVAGKERVYAVNAAIGRIAVVGERRGSVGVSGNVTDGYGRSFGISIIAGACVVAENRVTVTGRGDDQFAAVRVKAESAAVSANHVLTRREQPSISVDAGPVTVLGNITSSPILLNGGTLPAPWAALNA